jgi:hypothetical protein
VSDTADEGGDLPVQVDWSQLPLTSSLVQQNPSTPETLMAALGIDASQQQQGSESEEGQYA